MQRHSRHKAASLPPPEIFGSNRRPLVLCIDDDGTGLMLRRLVLESAGYDVASCLDGKTGLEIFSATPVSIVVLDYAMPGFDGLQVATLMRQIKPDVPIIMLSGYTEAPAGSAVLLDLYIVKSVSPDSLLTGLQELLQ